MPWKRPIEVPVGRVWSRFKGREGNGVPAARYQIRDMEEQHRTQCLDMMQETFIRDEPLCNVLDISSDPISIQSILSYWEELVSQQVSLACFTEENGEPKDLVGFNIVLVKSKDDDEEDFSKVKGEAWRKCWKTLETADRLVDVFELYGVDTYMSSSGLAVLSGHRGQNIGVRFMEARKELCKAFGIRAVCTVFSALSSQAIAAKCDYRVLATLPYSDMMQRGVDLSGCSSPHAKVMGIKFE